MLVIYSGKNHLESGQRREERMILRELLRGWKVSHKASFDLSLLT